MDVLFYFIGNIPRQFYVQREDHAEIIQSITSAWFGSVMVNQYLISVYLATVLKCKFYLLTCRTVTNKGHCNPLNMCTLKPVLDCLNYD